MKPTNLLAVEISLESCYAFFEKTYPGWTFQMISPQPTYVPSSQPTARPTVNPTAIPTVVPTFNPTSKPTQFPTTQLTVWTVFDDCYLSNPIIGFNNQETFNTYDEAFYAWEVAYPSCIGFSKDPATALFTLDSNYLPNFMKNAQSFIVRKTNAFDYTNPTSYSNFNSYECSNSVFNFSCNKHF